MSLKPSILSPVTPGCVTWVDANSSRSHLWTITLYNSVLEQTQARHLRKGGIRKDSVWKELCASRPQGICIPARQSPAKGLHPALAQVHPLNRHQSGCRPALLVTTGQAERAHENANSSGLRGYGKHCREK